MPPSCWRTEAIDPLMLFGEGMAEMSWYLNANYVKLPCWILRMLQSTHKSNVQLISLTLQPRNEIQKVQWLVQDDCGVSI